MLSCFAAFADGALELSVGQQAHHCTGKDAAQPIALFPTARARTHEHTSTHAREDMHTHNVKTITHTSSCRLYLTK